MAAANPSVGAASGDRPEGFGEVLDSLPRAVSLDEFGYQALLDRVHKIIDGRVAPGAAVLVVSRGDDDLVALHGRRGWHFPRHDDGRYAGHYPENSGVAVDHLEDLRAKGADYILFPATAFWWFEHYPEFAHHLKTRYPTVVQVDDSGVLFALRDAPASAVPGLVGSVLPDDARILVVSSGDESMVRVEGKQAWHFPHTETGDFDDHCSGEEALDRLDKVIETGADYLVLPITTPSWLEAHPGFFDEVERRYREVLRREYLCAVFSLTEPAQGGRGVEASDRGRGDG